MLKKFNIADWYDLKGQVAIVTGGATGLGLAITLSLIHISQQASLSQMEQQR